MKDAAFYSVESTQYSSKRYPRKAATYVQYFFKDRLSRTLALLRDWTRSGEELSLLEVGCADGVVLRAICESSGARIRSCVGIDTAEGMIDAARASTTDPRIAYFLRGQEPEAQYGAVLEVGVANYTDFDAEIDYAAQHLAPQGVYILSIAGDGSINRLLGHGVGYQHCYPYQAYEKAIRARFEIQKTVPIGIYLPLVWRLPAFARMLQPVVETLLRPLAPNLFHEKLYVLKPLARGESTVTV